MKSEFFFISFFTFLCVPIRYLLNIVITREFGFESFAYYQLIINYGNLLGVLFAAGFGLLAVQSFSGNKIYHLKYENLLVRLYFSLVGGATLFLIILALIVGNLGQASIFLVLMTALCFSFNRVVSMSLTGLKKQILSVAVRDFSMPSAILLLIFLTTVTMEQLIFSRNIILFIAASIALIFVLKKSKHFIKSKDFSLKKYADQ